MKNDLAMVAMAISTKTGHEANNAC